MSLFNKANRKGAKYVKNAIKKAGTIAIIGHVHPDGDDVASCLAMRLYAKMLNKDAKVTVFLEEFCKDFEILEGADKVCHDFSSDEAFDLGIMMDCADPSRMGEAGKYFSNARTKICIDHHATNKGENVGYAIINPERSSTCEVVCTILNLSAIPKDLAECLYLGIVHDTGVFKHTNTSFETMAYAGKLIECGVHNESIIDYTFFKKTFAQNKALGQVLMNSKLLLGGKLICGTCTKEDMEKFGVSSSDMDGVIDQLRITEGVEIAAFIYELDNGINKVSLRSNGYVDVSKIAVSHGGGGHLKAAGCEFDKTPVEIEKILEEEVAKLL